MSEQEFREGLQDAVYDEPPLSFDADALMVKAARETKRRRALFGASCATVAVAVAAVALPTLLGSPRGGSVGSGPGGTPAPVDPSCPSSVPMKPTAMTLTVPPTLPPTTAVPSGVPQVTPQPTSPQPGEPAATTRPLPLQSVLPPSASFEPDVGLTAYVCPPALSGSPAPGSTPPPTANPEKPKLDIVWPPPNLTPAHYTANQLSKRGIEMRQHLAKRFPVVVPGAKDVHPGVFGGESEGAVADGQNYLNAFTTFTWNGVKFAVDVSVFAPAEDSPGPDQQCADPTIARCEVIKQQDGSSTLRVTENIAQNGAAVLTSVIHYRTNGTVVRVTGYNYDPTAGTLPTDPAQSPLSIDQLTMLATDPALGL